MNRSVSFLLALFLVTWVLWSPAAADAQANEVRACLYVPGVSVPARMPAELATQARAKPAPAPNAPAVTQVGAEKTALQLRVLDELSRAVNDRYVYADFRGHDWKGLTARYRALIQQGLSDADFYAAMGALVRELGDEHSYFQSPAQIKEEEAAIASQYNFVGVGALFKPIAGTESAVFMSIFPDGPAAQAGLRSHDVLLHVDGGPIREKSGVSRTLGVEGSPVRLTVQRPGGAPRDVTLTRRRVTGILPLDYCVVPHTRIGYIFLPTLLDKTMDRQVAEALQKMTMEGPLRGLVLDNRLNGGGLGSVAKTIMGLFAGGVQGDFVSRTSREPLQLKPEDVGGSQTVPLVVLVDSDTTSFAEIMSGVLRVAGRARLLGGRTSGHVEQLRAYKFSDGSRAWLASDTFAPRGLTNGIWEEKGVIPDVALPTRWDLFTEANDPALAKAVELLTKR